MKNVLKEKISMVALFICFYVIVEAITFRWLGFDFLPQYMIINIILLSILLLVIWIIKSSLFSILYLSSLYFLILTVSFVNQTMVSELNGEIFSISHLALFGEATQVFEASYINLGRLLILIALFALFMFLLLRIRRAFKLDKKIVFFQYYKFMAPYFMIFIILLTSVSILNKNTISRYGRYSQVALLRKQSFKNYGMIGFYYKELGLLFSDGHEQRNDLEKELIIVDPYEYFNDDYSSHFLGLLKDYNVITIMIETGINEGVNQYLTPNLWRMKQEGLVFSNHFAENKTNVSESIGITGYFPSYGYNLSRFDFDLSFSLPSILSNQGYRTVFFHENQESFYGRGEVMPLMGFTETHLHESLFPDEPIYGWGGDFTLDSRTMERMLDFMFSESQNENFYYFWTTLVGHGPYAYNYPSERLDGLNNIQKFTLLGYYDLIDQMEEAGLWFNLLEDDPVDAERFRYFQATMMDFDVALGLLLEELEDNGLLDETLIILYGDHNAYYHNLHLKLHDVKEGDVHEIDMYRTFFALYNPKLTEAYLSLNPSHSNTIDKFISTYDILPTVYHLLGTPFYDNFVMGESIFSLETSIFYSHKMSAFFDLDFFAYNTSEPFYPNIDDIEDLDALADFLRKGEVFADKASWIENWFRSVDK